MQIIRFITLICITLIITGISHAKEWRGIRPLHSTRADVERMLGAGRGECNCLYETNTERVRIDYARGPCEGSWLWGRQRGWNVLADTVLRITIGLRDERPFSDLQLDLTRFTREADDTLTTYYASRDEGIEYIVSSDGLVSAITYAPSTRDMHLRCPCYPSLDDSFYRSRPFAYYSNIPFTRAMDRLANVAFEMEANQTSKGYIIAYAGRRARVGEAAAHGRRARNYLIQRRNIAPDRIVVIDGGHREQFEVELFLFPSDWPAPTPFPTIGSCDIQIIRGARRRQRRA